MWATFFSLPGVTIKTKLCLQPTVSHSCQIKEDTEENTEELSKFINIIF